MKNINMYIHTYIVSATFFETSGTASCGTTEVKLCFPLLFRRSTCLDWKVISILGAMSWACHSSKSGRQRLETRKPKGQLTVLAWQPNLGMFGLAGAESALCYSFAWPQQPHVIEPESRKQLPVCDSLGSTVLAWLDAMWKAIPLKLIEVSLQKTLLLQSVLFFSWHPRVFWASCFHASKTPKMIYLVGYYMDRLYGL